MMVSSSHGAPNLGPRDRTAGAVIARTPAEAKDFVQRVRASPALGPLAPPSLRVLVLQNGGLAFPGPDGEASGFFQYKWPGVFDAVFVDDKVRLFSGPWGETFVASAGRLAAPAGDVIFPVSHNKRPSGVLDASLVAEILGSPARPLEAPFALYRASRAARAPSQSVLTWYLANSAGLLLDGLLGSPARSAHDPLLTGCLEAPSVRANGENDGLRAASPSGDDLGERIAGVADAHNYLIQGLSYKAPIIAHIIGERMAGRGDLTFADIGGAFGALAAELLLTPGCGISTAVTRDIASQNVSLSQSLYLGLHGQLRDRFKFSLGAAETFPFHDRHDVIAFIGSLLYVPKDRREDTIRAAWSCLKPSGLLIVHENIKAPAYERDRDVMFEPEELNLLLGKYGDIACYLSTAPASVPLADAARRTVFRVVQKRP